MTIEYRPPCGDEAEQLQELFTEAFHDEWFTELFFQRGYSPDRCLLAAAEGQVLAAMHWFDCTVHGRRCAYVYGIAAFARHRGRGVGSALIRAALKHLQKTYEAVLLVPAEEGLFGYYERFGFRTVSTICQETVLPGVPVPVRKLGISEYAQLRRAYLPANGVIQEGAALELLEGYADFYATENAICAVSGRLVWELLGDKQDAPGILGALGIPDAILRTPGGNRPFAMGLGLAGPVHFGLALD